jgi:tRNA dimethylallyltransferase
MRHATIAAAEGQAAGRQTAAWPVPILLLGPTASGKSALALALAAQVPLEIISLDSAQVYRGLDIGTAKPDAVQRAQVPHHLLDLRAADQPYSVAEYLADAREAVTQVTARGRLALVTGGTMMYAKVLRDGLADLPSADPAWRVALEAEARQLGWPALHARLAAIDPVTAARLAPADRQRIGRALEVHALSGQPLSALLARQAPGIQPLATIALKPSSKPELHARIARRWDAMVAAGFLEEVAALRKLPGLHADLPALRSVGYRQVWEWLDAGGPEAGARAQLRLREAALQATRGLAKRQLTWLRAMGADRVIDPFAGDALEKLKSAVSELQQRP